MNDVVKKIVVDAVHQVFLDVLAGIKKKRSAIESAARRKKKKKSK